jgi:hypothetical protein
LDDAAVGNEPLVNRDDYVVAAGEKH